MTYKLEQNNNAVTKEGKAIEKDRYNEMGVQTKKWAQRYICI